MTKNNTYPYPVYNIRLNWWITFCDIYVSRIPNEEKRVMRLFPRNNEDWYGIVYEPIYNKHLKEPSQLQKLTLEQAIHICADLYNYAESDMNNQTLLTESVSGLNII